MSDEKRIAEELKRIERASARMINKVDRAELEMFLEDASNPKCETLVAMLRDPGYRSKTMAQMVKMCGLTMLEVQQVVMDGLRQIALVNLHASLPNLMDDVVEDARSKLESCPRCDGLQVLPFGENGTRPCPSCQGMGKVRRTGDRHARDLVFESAKLTGQKGPMVAIQNNVAIGDARMESILKKTRQIVLDDKTTTIHGEGIKEGGD